MADTDLRILVVDDERSIRRFLKASLGSQFAILARLAHRNGDGLPLARRFRAVAHLGRTINASLRTALALRDRHCVVPGCGVGYSLEIDHVHPLEHGGRTELANLALS